MEINIKYNQLKELKTGASGKVEMGEDSGGLPSVYIGKPYNTCYFLKPCVCITFVRKKKTMSFLMAGNMSLVTIKFPVLYMA